MSNLSLSALLDSTRALHERFGDIDTKGAG